VASHGISGATAQAQKGTTSSSAFWKKSKGDPNKVNPAPKGWDWVPVRNNEGVFVGYMLTRDKSEGKTGGSTGGSSGGGGYGGSSGASAGLSAYTQAYRIMFDNGTAKPPAALLQKAEAGNWSVAYWNMMVRLTDKAYFKSAEARQNLAELRTYWGAVLPGVKLNKSFARDYLRHGWSATQLQNQISQLPNFKKQYPFWRVFQQAQRAAGTAKNIDPLAYKQYQKGFADVWKQAGGVTPQGYEKLFFKSGITDDEFVQNYQALASGTPSATWDVGGVTEQQKQAELFNGKGASQVRGLLQIALNKQAGYMKSRINPFQIQTEDETVKLKGL
jgi:hypothetical protein